MATQTRNTVENFESYKKKITFSPEVRKGSRPLPYAAIRIKGDTGEKKAPKFKLYIEEGVFVSNWFFTSKESEAKGEIASVKIHFRKDYPQLKLVKKFFAGLTAMANDKIQKDESFRERLEIPEDHVVENPLKYDETTEDHWTYAAVSLNNMTDQSTGEDTGYGAFNVEDIEGDRCTIGFLRRNGWIGSITDLQIELKGKYEKKTKNSTMHLELKLTSGVAGEPVPNTHGSNEDVRSSMREKYGEKLAEFKKLKAAVAASGDGKDDDPHVAAKHEIAGQDEEEASGEDPKKSKPEKKNGDAKTVPSEGPAPTGARPGGKSKPPPKAPAKGDDASGSDTEAPPSAPQGGKKPTGGKSKPPAKAPSKGDDEGSDNDDPVPPPQKGSKGQVKPTPAKSKPPAKAPSKGDDDDAASGSDDTPPPASRSDASGKPQKGKKPAKDEEASDEEKPTQLKKFTKQSAQEALADDSGSD